MKKIDRFSYLGSVLTADARYDTESRRIGNAKSAYRKMSYMLASSRISIETRKKAFKTHVGSTLLCGCEAWTVSRKMKGRLEAMEMWCWTRMLRVRWSERRSNANILKAIGSRRELFGSFKETIDGIPGPRDQSR